MTPAEKKDRLQFVGDLAARHFEELSVADRARLCEGLSLAWTGEASEQSAFTAFAIRKSETAQLKFIELLRS